MIYLDYAAATPVSKKAYEAMKPYFSDIFFNPSAAYLPAKHLRAAYESAKNRIANCIGAKSPDLVITSGATEATNLAFTCLKFLCLQDKNTPYKALVLETEHSSVLEVARNYNFDTIKVKKSGIIDLDDFKKKLDENVALVSVSLVNNELGTIQPLSEISEIIRKERESRLKQGIKTPLYLHSDASQALSLLDINVSRLGVDLLTLNSAKVYGPKGVGALYVSHGVRLCPISYGGGQEQGLRSGTENVPAVFGFAEAIEEAKSHLLSSRKNYQMLKSLFKNEFRDFPREYIFLGNDKNQLANFIPISFPGIDAERLIYKLEEKEIYVSTGAACAANKGSKSHVLVAIGLTDSEIAGSLRISMGKDTKKDDILAAARAIKLAVEEEYARKSR